MFSVQISLTADLFCIRARMFDAGSMKLVHRFAGKNAHNRNKNGNNDKICVLASIQLILNYLMVV